MKIIEVSSGRVKLQVDRQSPLPLSSEHHSPLCRHSHPLRLHRYLLHLLLTRKDGSSRCCFVTWWTLHDSPANSTRKTCGRWCELIKTPVPRSLPVLRAISRSISVMGCSSISGILSRTKMMPSGPCGPGWASSQL